MLSSLPFHDRRSHNFLLSICQSLSTRNDAMNTQASGSALTMWSWVYVCQGNALALLCCTPAAGILKKIQRRTATHSKNIKLTGTRTPASRPASINSNHYATSTLSVWYFIHIYRRGAANTGNLSRVSDANDVFLSKSRDQTAPRQSTERSDRHKNVTNIVWCNIRHKLTYWKVATESICFSNDT